MSYFYPTPLYYAIEEENIDIIKLLLTDDRLNTYFGNILTICLI